MRGLVAASACFLGITAKGIKQQMVENRLKFDRDVLAHGADQEDMDYDDWDPFLDLDDDELEVRSIWT